MDNGERHEHTLSLLAATTLVYIMLIITRKDTIQASEALLLLMVVAGTGIVVGAFSYIERLVRVEGEL